MAVPATSQQGIHRYRFSEMYPTVVQPETARYMVQAHKCVFSANGEPFLLANDVPLEVQVSAHRQAYGKTKNMYSVSVCALLFF